MYVTDLSSPPPLLPYSALPPLHQTQCTNAVELQAAPTSEIRYPLEFPRNDMRYSMTKPYLPP
jgi:hypothetical protein